MAWKNENAESSEFALSLSSRLQNKTLDRTNAPEALSSTWEETGRQSAKILTLFTIAWEVSSIPSSVRQSLKG